MNGYTAFIILMMRFQKYEDFDKTMADYLTFEFNMITHGRGYLFGLEGDDDR